MRKTFIIIGGLGVLLALLFIAYIFWRNTTKSSNALANKRNIVETSQARAQAEKWSKAVANTKAADSDMDGLSDAEEQKVGTSIQSIDTDGDGLTDYDEVQYHSNPLKVDTLGDGRTDGWRVKHRLNPATGKPF